MPRPKSKPSLVEEQKDHVLRQIEDQATKMKDQKKQLEDTLKEVSSLQKKYDSLEKELQNAISHSRKLSSRLKDSIEETEQKKTELAEVKKKIKSSPKNSFEEVAPSFTKADRLNTSIHKLLQEQQKIIPPKETIMSWKEDIINIEKAISSIKRIKGTPKSTSPVKRPAEDDGEERKQQQFPKLDPVKLEPDFPAVKSEQIEGIQGIQDCKTS